jgi:hypothetical protein
LTAGEICRVAIVFIAQTDEIEQLGRGVISSFGVLSSSRGNATLPNTVREASRLKCWKIMPI